MEKFKPQVPFSLETERATKQSPRLHQPELLTEWSEFYPEDIDPPPPEQNNPPPVLGGNVGNTNRKEVTSRLGLIPQVIVISD